MHKKMVRNLCDTTSNMYAAFQRNFSDPIWEAYKIESLSPDSSAYVIDMSSLFITDVPEFSPFRSENIMDVLMKRKALKGSLASSKSTILGMKCFPLNINIKTLMSYTVDGGPFTVTMTRNIILLPEEIMRPRYGDSRIGYFDESKRFYTEKKDGLQNLLTSTDGICNQNQKTWNVISKVSWWNLRSRLYITLILLSPTSGEIT